jgi:hypothetical protein
MTATFLVELDVEDDTDLVSIAQDLSDSINQHFDYDALSVKPWKREALAATVTVPPPAPSL